MRFFLLVSLFFLPAFVAGCENSPAGLRIISMRIGKQTFHLEVADTPASQERGLMNRDAMPADHGMIFIMDGEEVRQFWMKNTRFPLDILFINSSGRIVSIRRMAAKDENLTSSDYLAHYAIELNQGAAESAGVKAGDVLIIPDEAKSK